MRFAIVGIRHLVDSEPNARIHLIATLLVIGLCVVLPVNLIEICLLILSIGLVWMAEAFNSAIERLADRITSDEDPLVKQAKDLSAAAVLLISLTTLVIGLIIFGRHLLPYF